MQGFMDFISSYFLIAVGTAWLSSVILKWSFNLIRGENKRFASAFSNGGMPSSHSALVASLSTAIYVVEGLSSVFYLSLIITIIIMSDAIRVRKNLGEQGDSINKILMKFKQNPIKVVHGHSGFQVLVGALWGVFVALLIFHLFF
ncbi:MAG: divergent PAP2 family protein [Candidatus Nanoarchaeia archaeon]